MLLETPSPAAVFSGGGRPHRAKWYSLMSMCPGKSPSPPPAVFLGGGCSHQVRLLHTNLFGPQGELVTASKAIIEKEYQPHVIVSTTGPNPFNTLTDRELEEYRREVERKQKGSEGECS